jgi:hypothetical protein
LFGGHKSCVLIQPKAAIHNKTKRQQFNQSLSDAPTLFRGV